MKCSDVLPHLPISRSGVLFGCVDKVEKLDGPVFERFVEVIFDWSSGGNGGGAYRPEQLPPGTFRRGSDGHG